MKKSVGFVLSLVLIFSFLFPPQSLEAAVQSPGPKLRILEIVATGESSQLKSILGNDYEYTLMTMKKFVAQREELDGKYDVIAIMEGNYTSDPVKSKEHNTSAVMNDITNLKANEIINDFINKGQPVILHTKSLATGSKLKAKFSNQDQDLLSKSNVINYDSTSTNSSGSFWDRWYEFWYGNSKNNNESTQTDKDNLKKAFNDFLKGDKYKQSPRFTLTNSPNKENKYEPDDNLEFTMNVEVPTNINSRSLKAKLYIDSNFDDKYTTDEIVLEENVTAKSTNLSFKLPKGYSGVRYWKMELVDSGNNLKSYEKGMIKFVNQPVAVKVLQVTKNKNDLSSLKSEKNMKQTYLKRTNEYDIAIEVTDIATFNSSLHNTINGKYDMVIFGFADVYNDATINDNAVKSLKNYIASGQSIMFTHDTIYNTNNNWVNHFKEATGQTGVMTNLGLNAPNKSTGTSKMNSGLMTEYPFSLSNSITIAQTHNQYYTLDLEDPDIISWYNIKGSDRDVNDSWNHFYTYSKGNITYSGTGHTSTGFPDDEQKLFVNTMYRAFLGSNHAPEITIHTPTANQVIPTNQNIELSYTLQDYDLKDKKVSTKVFMDDKELSAETDVTNGTTIKVSIPHNLQESKPVTIKVQATDESGAVSEKEVKVNVQKINANLEVRRSMKPNNLVEVGQPVKIEYTVTPKNITGNEAKAISGDSVIIASQQFKETFPANLEVISNGKQTGSVETGITLEKTLGNITYSKVGDVFIADPLTFEVEVKPTAKKQYILANSILSYQDLSNIQKDLTFNTLSFNADRALTGIDFPTSYVLSKGTEKNFLVDLKILPADSGIKSISWSEESRGEMLDLDSSLGTAKVLKEGDTFLKVTVTDMFEHVFEKRVPVTVRIPVDSFTLTDLTLDVGQTLPLPITDVKPEEKGKSSLEMKVKDEDIASVDKEKLTITGLKTGETTLTMTGIDTNGKPVIHTSVITVREVPVTGIQVKPPSVTMNKYDVRNDFEVIIAPSNATDRTVEWKSLDSSIVEILENGKIKGVSTGTANIEVISKSNPEIKGTIKVQVGQPLEGISVPEIKLQKGTSQPIIVHPSPADATNVFKTEFSPLKNDYITISDGAVHGVRVGKTEITVTVTDDNGKKYPAIVKVTVIPKKEEGSNDNQDKY